MRRLAVYLNGYKKECVLAPLFKLLEVVFDLMVPVVVARMIDVGVANDDRRYMAVCFGILILMAAVGLGCTICAQFFAARASVGVASKLRQAVFDHIQSLSFTELDRMGSDTMITRLTGDINQVQNGLNMGLRLLLRSPFVVLGSMVMAFTIDVRCAWIFAVTIPILFAAVFAIMLVSIPLFGKVQKALDRVTGLTRENLTGVRVIRAFCREERSVEEFDRESRELTRLSEFVGRISALLNPLTYVLINIAAVVLIRRAAIEVNMGELLQGQVVALYNYMLQIIVELVKLASLIITLNKAMACARRVADVLGTESSMSFPATDAPDTRGEYAVEFRGVRFAYADAGAPSLEDISFRVRHGQTVGIIGGTGAGKSTLVNLIPRFYDAGEGEVLLDGRDVRSYTRETLRSRVGIVQQKAVLFGGSIRDNLKLGAESADDAALWEALRAAQAEEVVRGKPGQLDFELEQNGRNLSGGQKQRMSIARTLVRRPEVLILDDSSSALDFATDAALRRAVRSLPWKPVTFLVSQRIMGIRDADLILVLDNGRLAGQGTHDELMRGCRIYREIYESQYPDESRKED